MSPAVGILLGTCTLVGYFGLVYAIAYFWYDIVAKRYPRMVENMAAFMLSMATSILLAGCILSAAVAIWQ